MNRYLSLKDHVYNFISEQIGNGALAPEEKINEQQICDKLNISRTPVREALIQLATEGYLENLPRKGFIVKPIDERKARELYTVIGALDGLAAFLAAGRMTEKELNHMKYLVSAMYIAIDNDTYDIYYKLQMEFHSVYTDLCGNTELIHFLNRLKKSFLRQNYRTTDSADMAEILRTTNDEHQVMMGLFEKKNAAEIQNYVRDVHWDPGKAIFDLL